MRIKIDEQPVIDRAEFGQLLGLKIRSSFDKRRARDPNFPAPYASIHGHPYWLQTVADDYAATYIGGRRVRHGLGVRDSHMRPAPQQLAS